MGGRGFRRGRATSSKGRRARLAGWRWLLLAGITLATAYLGITSDRQGPASSARFEPCLGSSHETCVLDGDTLRLEGVTIRIADIDTPEIFSPRCPSEKALGIKAKLRLIELMNEGPFRLAAWERDEDRYGRKLRILERDGRSLGAALVAEGLARRWDGARRSWCDA